ncbi:uncharacterized protein DUF262 [Bacillus altitudinis]|nr:DUF262 domain-containing protein [Bacillus altitudinis]EMI14774.1 pf03235 family protein [Bacillus stratosphericus LAMA 585]MCY7672019.1 DUF262 domain-containing protein [Bacillus altitudinis]MDR7670697.1 DUF262 domain-containing protein [Bacillus altitudinis]QDZ96314.1 DUF262 domain-containing protein [Bacillus altitudinis]
MGLIKSELSIVTLKELLKLNLAIPEYQRPYRWEVTSSNTLFMDTYEAYQQGLGEYRIGSVILHKKDGVYHIVDGQQRLTTLIIFLFCLGESNNSLLNEQYSIFSTKAVVNNMKLFRRKMTELQLKDSEYKSYLLNHCSAVKIVTDDEQEAFQFFDSQNSRGKELAPHDLLKSYHLREMNTADESSKINIINKWENKNQLKLEKLFESYLYPITQWHQGNDGVDYSSKKIKTFKGVKNNHIYNYAIYHKASNLHIEQLNSNGTAELLSIKPLNQFQLTQPVITGKRFFEYTLHYAHLLKRIQKRIKDFHKNVDEIPNKQSGDMYIKQLYEKALMFFADRFGEVEITDMVLNQMYTWCYSFRLVMKAVYVESTNKYAIGRHSRLNEGIDLFTRISKMNEPEEFNLLIFERIDETKVANKEKYSKVWERLKVINGW